MNSGVLVDLLFSSCRFLVFLFQSDLLFSGSSLLRNVILFVIFFIAAIDVLIFIFIVDIIRILLPILVIPLSMLSETLLFFREKLLFFRVRTTYGFLFCCSSQRKCTVSPSPRLPLQVFGPASSDPRIRSCTRLQTCVDETLPPLRCQLSPVKATMGPLSSRGCLHSLSAFLRFLRS